MTMISLPLKPFIPHKPPSLPVQSLPCSWILGPTIPDPTSHRCLNRWITYIAHEQLQRIHGYKLSKRNWLTQQQQKYFLASGEPVLSTSTTRRLIGDEPCSE